MREIRWMPDGSHDNLSPKFSELGPAHKIVAVIMLVLMVGLLIFTIAATIWGLIWLGSEMIDAAVWMFTHSPID